MYEPKVLSQQMLDQALETRKRLMCLIDQLHAMDETNSFNLLFGERICDSTSQVAQRNMSMRPALKHDIDECQAFLAEAFLKVESLRQVAELDFRSADVLENRYFFDRSWALIADSLGISQATCYRIRREALVWIEESQSCPENSKLHTA